jgi:hypothetical protein
MRHRLLLAVAVCAFGLGLASFVACESDPPPTADADAGAPDRAEPAFETGADAAVLGPRDSGSRGEGSDARGDVAADGCPAPETAFDAGETCIGFGTGGSCNTACGLPPYGYACAGGGPPNVAGCVRASYSPILGGTYCCSELKCVRSPSEDPSCADAGEPPRFYQCPTDGDGGLLAQPGAGCQATSGPSPYKYYCCPN